MAGQDGGYALGVDLGTSNTVAVLRWPDGRTRPLLFDGRPILPSGVFLGDRLHVGRDAQRLAQTDPARFEPNPKRRVDEPAVLLGSHEVPTVDLLAAVLDAVARTAVEAVGFLPPAVLTYPATWGGRRREVLVRAVARAGWPPVLPAGPAGTRLVPEPVAAARYFTDVLRRPVPVGQALAVFDFGGGTLDIAVVRNEGTDPSGRARFDVIGSGGVPELGGLDLDAALVEHLSTVVTRVDPQAWQRLVQPSTPGQWRDRRRFWDDVRGAKEMLSRSVVAPVAVPGVDQAVHLTREELEQVAAPLLRRGVTAAAGVIAASQLRADQLAGLFLVGGSSRVPLVARMLHSELGIAPTVLEQPELPVAEGALAELGQPAEAATMVSPAGPPVVSPVSAGPSVAGPASGPPAQPSYPPAQPSYPPRSVPPAGPPGTDPDSAGPAPVPAWHRRPVTWLVAAACLALAGVVAAAVLYFLPDSARAIEFRAFTQVGDALVLPEEAGSGSDYYTQLVDGKAYGAFVRDDDRLGVVAIDPSTAKQRWEAVTSVGADRWLGLRATPDALIATGDSYGADSRSPVVVFDPRDGRERWTFGIDDGDQLFVFDDVLVWSDVEGGRLVGLDLRDGDERWSHDNPADQYDDTASVVYPMVTRADLAGPADAFGGAFAPDRGDDRRLVQITATRSARIFDAGDGELLSERPNVAAPTDIAMVYDGRLLVAASGGGYRLTSYDLASTDEPANLYTPQDDTRRLNGIVGCGPDRVCLLEATGFGTDTNELVVVDMARSEVRWRTDAAGFDVMVPVGEHVLLRQTSSGYLSVLFDPEGNEVLRRDGVAVRLDRGNLLVFAENPSSYPDDASVAGVSVAAAPGVQELGLLRGVRAEACSWDQSRIVCPTDAGFLVSRFTD
ncbi:Hsp70 family protein [Solwaraspora sp. WMMD406]|uniref:Hsp70 family protein n=1 Tax=Solwaraspora sp. WMMD406 TaxID=3016095 RepID=UPI002417AA3F|nr:Hsp70 family protein [Solwaraspora sp. WMMD406]MDG4768333.1 Hsp70 family protein [Solwaraspora sp. WMMD406]